MTFRPFVLNTADLSRSNAVGFCAEIAAFIGLLMLLSNSVFASFGLFDAVSWVDDDGDDAKIKGKNPNEYRNKKKPVNNQNDSFR